MPAQGKRRPNRAQKNDPRYDPWAISKVHYTNLVTGCFPKMDRDYRIVRPEGTADWLLMMTTSGEGIIRSGPCSVTLRANQLALFRPGMAHDYGCAPNASHWGLVWAHFHSPHHWLPLFIWSEPIPGMLFLDLPKRSKEARRIAATFHEVHRISNSIAPRRDWLAMNELESLLLRCVHLSARSGTGADLRLEKALEYIEQHLDRPIYLPALANTVLLSVSQFSALFRKALKTSPQTYVELRRMERAGRLLQVGSLSIKEIAWMVGFEDPLYFSKRFKRHWGHSPSLHREKTRKPQEIPSRAG